MFQYQYVKKNSINPERTSEDHNESDQIKGKKGKQPVHGKTNSNQLSNSSVSTKEKSGSSSQIVVEKSENVFLKAKFNKQHRENEQS